MGHQGLYPRRGSSELLNSCWSLCRWRRGYQRAAPQHPSLLIMEGTCLAVRRMMLKAWWKSQVRAEVPKKPGHWVKSTVTERRSIVSQADLCIWLPADHSPQLYNTIYLFYFPNERNSFEILLFKCYEMKSNLWVRYTSVEREGKKSSRQFCPPEQK